MSIKAQTGPGAEVPMCAKASPPWPPRGAPSPKTSLITPHRLATLTAALLLIDDARIDGLIDFDPSVDRTRCRRVLGNLRREGVVPDQGRVASVAVELMAELGALRR